MTKSYQVAALPMRRAASGVLEVLLITTRGSRRWVVPKGWPWRNFSDQDAAAGEAWEEAGVRGTTSAVSIGSYSYRKRWNGAWRPLTVRVYVMEVTEEASAWPEAAERQRGWFALAVAAELVAEAELKIILLTFEQAAGLPAGA